MKGRKIFHIWTRFLIIACMAFIAIVVFTLLIIPYSLPTTFNLTVQTERIEFFSKEKPPSRWVFQDAEITQSYSDSTTNFTGTIELSDSIKVLIERVALGPLWIHIEATGKNNIAGRFFSEAEEPLGRAKKIVEIVISDIPTRAISGQSIVIPLTGEVETGRQVGIETIGTTAILRSGKISMLGQTIFRKDIFEAGSLSLNMGDQVMIEAADSQAFGFAVADERPALTVAYRVIGTRANILRPGGGAYPVYVTFLNRLSNDPMLQGVAFFFGMLVILTSLLSFFFESGNYFLWKKK